MIDPDFTISPEAVAYADGVGLSADAARHLAIAYQNGANAAGERARQLYGDGHRNGSVLDWLVAWDHDPTNQFTLCVLQLFARRYDKHGDRFAFDPPPGKPTTPRATT